VGISRGGGDDFGGGSRSALSKIGVGTEESDFDGLGGPFSSSIAAADVND
jgi:hypothetical protein